jgi:Lar family restriction alleviation protein
MKAKNGLRCCPFCGSDAAVDYWEVTAEHEPRYGVYCKKCNATGANYRHQPEAIAAWNKRCVEGFD